MYARQVAGEARPRMRGGSRASRGSNQGGSKLRSSLPSIELQSIRTLSVKHSINTKQYHTQGQHDLYLCCLWVCVQCSGGSRHRSQRNGIASGHDFVECESYKRIHNVRTYTFFRILISLQPGGWLPLYISPATNKLGAAPGRGLFPTVEII